MLGGVGWRKHEFENVVGWRLSVASGLGRGGAGGAASGSSPLANGARPVASRPGGAVGSSKRRVSMGEVENGRMADLNVAPWPLTAHGSHGRETFSR